MLSLAQIVTPCLAVWHVVDTNNEFDLLPDTSSWKATSGYGRARPHARILSESMHLIDALISQPHQAASKHFPKTVCAGAPVAN